MTDPHPTPEPLLLQEWTVFAFYKFLELPHFATLQAPLRGFLEEQQIFGTLLLAAEGINGTVAGRAEAIETLQRFLSETLALGPVDGKFATCAHPPFGKSKVKLKKEIVALGRPDLNPATRPVGEYVDPADWNQLLADPQVRLIDTRNDFEVRMGTFAGAENPRTQSFREFADYVTEHLDPAKDRKVAMFCTGGIRCEKATALLREKGFEEVYHLKGGILKYLEEIPQENSLWQGNCFVFDERVAVGHGCTPQPCSREIAARAQ